MKSILLFILLSASTIFFLQCKDFKSSSDTKKMVWEVSHIIKSKSLFSDSLNWNQIDDSLSLLPFGKVDSTNNQLIFNFFRNKLRSAGDKHSFFLTKKQIESYVIKNPEPKLPEGEYLGDGIGLIKVPHFSNLASPNITSKDFANNIRFQIKKIDTHDEINSWIVDLRGNNGGDMWPMLGGLNALIKDGIVGYFIGTKSQKEIGWESENGKMDFASELIDTYKVKKLPLKIAILIDSMTASSGEMTAISFIGLANVKVFGQPSAGFVTANTTINLSDGTLLNLATSNVADRTHKIYSDKIIPDVIVKIHISSHVDETLEIAKNWLLKIDNK
jgi:C-terminal processing protease CtpA/Prc